MIDLRLGDCIDVLKTLPDNSVDSVVCDPPYHLTPNKNGNKGFMGKEWDGGDIAFRTEVWSECLRVLKPGGHLLAFGGSRTYHRLAVAVEDAGFEIRDQLLWIYAQGFPKSHNISKAIDKLQGNEREVIGRKIQRVDGTTRNKQPNGGFMKENVKTKPSDGYIDIEKPGSEDSEKWEGWGSNLKPAHEPIVMARKPISEKSIAENVLKWGTGAINIDDCRIESEVRTTPVHSEDVKDDTTMFGLHKTIQHERVETTEGRFPANIMFECICDETLVKPAPKSGHWSKTTTKGFGEFGNGSSTYEGVGEKESGNMIIHTNPDCPCYILDQQSGVKKSGFNPKANKKQYEGGVFGGGETNENNGYGDKGGASRFFFTAKASKKERNMGLDNFNNRPSQLNSGGIGRKISVEKRLNENGENAPTTKNHHPTIKPIKLMEYLITLVTPKEGIVLDCFMGSGSTGIAARNNGYSFIGIEKEQEYFDIAEQRINSTYQTKMDI